MELRFLGKQYPFIAKEIDEWIRRNVKEMGVEVSIDRISYDDKGRVEHELERAARDLGTTIAVHYNPAPMFQKSEESPYLTCHLSAFVFKNDYGK